MKVPTIHLIPLRAAVSSDAATTLDVLVRIIPPAAEVELKRPTLNIGLVIDRSGYCDNGRMPLPVRFKTAPPGNNCAHCGLRSKKITTSTKSSMTMNITRFCAKSGQSAGISFGTNSIPHPYNRREHAVRLPWQWSPLELKLCTQRRPGEGDHIADIPHTRHKLHHPLKS